MTTTTPPAPVQRKRRGFEGTGDMVRSLGLILLVVLPIWFLAQPSPEDEREIRPVDQAADVAAWTSAVAGAPVPTAPEAWTPTVSRYDGDLRLGWNTDTRRYAEFAASASPGPEYLAEITGTSTQDGVEDVGGVSWRRYVDDDGSLSLVREVGGTTVVVGTTRASASLDELRTLAASVEP